MEDCIGCRSPDEVREVVLQAVRCEELGTYVFDPYKVLEEMILLVMTIIIFISINIL